MITKQQIREALIEGLKKNKLGATTRSPNNRPVCVYHEPVTGKYCAWGYVFHKQGIDDTTLQELDQDLDAVSALERLRLQTELYDDEAQNLQHYHDQWATKAITMDAFQYCIDKLLPPHKETR